MTTSPWTGFTELEESETIPQPVVVEMGRRIEGGASLYPVEDKDENDPPGTCDDGAQYIIAATATGDWTGHEGKIATAVGANASNGWLIRAVSKGVFAYVRDENALYYHNGTIWTAFVTGGTEASNVEIWAGAETGKFISPRRLFTANESVSVAYGATITLDGDDGFNFHTALTGDTEFANPVNMKAGQSGRIRITQDSTGSRLADWGPNWKFDGGPPTLTTTADAIDVVEYFCHSATDIEAHFRGDLEGAVGGAVSARYWQIEITALQSGLSVTNLNEVRLMEGATNRASGSTITANFDNLSAPNLINGDLSDAGGWWEANGSFPHLITLDHGASYLIDTLEMAPRNSWLTRVPATFKLKYSATGTSGPWTDALTRTGDMTSWVYNATTDFVL
jgi:hypothetical protein